MKVTHSLPRRRPAAVLSAGVTLAILMNGLPVYAAPPNPPAALETPSTTAPPIGESEASATATATGRPVAVTAATTPTGTVTANPDGSFTLTQTATPVRKLVGGVWKDLDPTLRTGSGGSITPTLATGDLTLSGGGDGPFATLSGGGRELALTLPFTLPKPTLAGATATYPDVLPDVDLRVTANAQGGFSEVLVVGTAEAAGNPEVAALTMAVRTTGIDLAADEAGNIAGTDATGHAIVTAAAPTMWDSRPATTTAVPNSGSGRPAQSGPSGPGAHARVAKLGVNLTKGELTLTPDKAMLGQATWPVYIDPTFAWGAATNGWAVIDDSHPATKYWKDSPSTQSDMQSGKDPDGTEVRRLLVNFPIDTSRLTKDANISAATLNITETWANNCTASNVDIYAPIPVVTSTNAFWNAWANVDLGTRNDQISTAHGYNSGCPAAGVGFDVLTGIKSAAAGVRKNQTFVIKANNESADSGWKRWDSSTPKLTVNYDHRPNVPSSLHTSPATSCSGTTVGDHDIKLYATVSDPDGSTLSETFSVYRATNTSITTGGTLTNVASGSGSTPYTVTEAWLKSNSGGVATAFRWSVTATQNSLSATSATCTFTFDPTRPHAPDVTVPTDAVIGKPATFTVNYVKNTGETTVPSSYQYQLNGGPIVTVAATASGQATFTAIPMRTVNRINVASASAGSNFSPDADDEPFTAAPAAPAVDADLTGDGTADLTVVGGSGTVPAGVWVAPGAGDENPSVLTAATDIGAYGNGTSVVGSPADFNGAQVITGRFSGNNLQDLLYYYPSGAKAGSGGVLAGRGDGSPVIPGGGDSQHSFSTGDFTDQSAGGNADEPTTMVNAGNSAGGNNGFVDLLGVAGDATDGYHLVYYPNTGGVTQYSGVWPLITPAPDGTMNWNQWTIVSSQRGDGTTDLFVWNKTTGALYLWSALRFVNDGDAPELDFTPHVLADGSTATFNKNTAVTLKAADINRDGVPDLWATTAAGVTTDWIVTQQPDQSVAIAANVSQTVLTAAHAWHLKDAADNTTGVTTALDSSGSLTAPLSGATWNSNDLISPDLAFNGSASVTAPGKAVTTNADFSVGFWAKPTAYDGVVVSQDGNTGPGFRVWPSNDGAWNFGMTTSDGGSTQDLARSAIGSARLNLWYHVVATYQSSTRTMRLYVNDRMAAAVVHSTAWAAGGNFQIGQARTGTAAWGTRFTGQVAEVSTYNQVVNPLPEPQHGVWEHTRSAAGAWPANGQFVDGNTTITTTAATTLPNGTMWIFNIVPGSGVWGRSRSASGAWANGAQKIDTNGSVTDVAAATLADGTVHLFTLLPGVGVYDRTLPPNGSWSSATRFDANTGDVKVAATALPNGTIHVQTMVTGLGVYDSARSTAGVWSTPVKIFARTGTTDVASAALPDGSMYVLALTPGVGVTQRIRDVNGTFTTSTETTIDALTTANSISAGGLPDSTMHLVVSVPGTGLHDQAWISGAWAGDTLIDTDPTVISSYVSRGSASGEVHVGLVNNPS
jgi:hypothetical protein